MDKNESEVEFIGLDNKIENKTEPEISLKGIIGRILTRIDEARLNGDNGTYLRGISQLITRCWSLLEMKKNMIHKNQLEKINDKYEKLAERKNPNEQEELQMDRAGEVEKVIMLLLYSKPNESNGGFEE